MQFFDLVAMKEESLDSLASRLGYKKIFRVGKELEVVEDLKSVSSSKKILVNDDFETISKALRQSDVIGMMPKSASISKKTLEAIKNNESVLFLPVAQVTCAEAGLRTQRLVRMRGWVRSALMAKVPFALVSMAESKEGMMSSAQMLDVAEFLGIGQGQAKEALARIGGLV
jgi:RNase P/RNase MRP subunit p30